MQRNGNGGNVSQRATPDGISKHAFRPATSTRLQSPQGDLPMELISSPSRGIDTADQKRDLTNYDTQETYRAYISQRLQAHRERFGPLSSNEEKGGMFPIILHTAKSPSKWSAAGLNEASLGSLQDILLLVRRLREGCVAAARQDAFVIDGE
jgi:hypothetical protein